MWYTIINNEYSGQPATRYLSGFAGSTSVLIFRSKAETKTEKTSELENHSQILKNMRMIENAYLLIDARYWEQESEIRNRNCRINNLNIVRVSREYSAKQAIKDIINKNSIGIVTIDSIITSHSSFAKLKDLGLEVVASENVFEKMRRVKTVDEIEKITKAIDIAEDAFAKIKKYIKVGVRESEIAARLEYEMKMLGAQKESFDTIVASGRQSASPHAETSAKMIEATDSVIIDFGCFYDGYASDLTKTILMPEASGELRKIYDIVKIAHDKAVQVVKPGVPAKDIDCVARKIIEDAGYDDKFLHSTGHGVGMSVHEFPHIGANSDDFLEKGNVITIEPGIYLPGIGGVRIETTEIVKSEQFTVNSAQFTI